MNTSTVEAAKEIESIFKEAKRALLFLHKQKMALIKKFKDADNATQAEDILNKLKSLQ
jgi:hypothetical protein